VNGGLENRDGGELESCDREAIQITNGQSCLLHFGLNVA
jgi:hypothetical protein